LHQGVGERFQGLNGMVVTLCAEVIGQLASGEIRVAVSDEQQVAIEPSVSVERGGGFRR